MDHRQLVVRLLIVDRHSCRFGKHHQQQRARREDPSEGACEAVNPRERALTGEGDRKRGPRSTGLGKAGKRHLAAGRHCGESRSSLPALRARGEAAQRQQQRQRGPR